MFASGNCQCAIHQLVRIIEIGYGIRFRETVFAFQAPISIGIKGILVNFPDTASDISVRRTLIIEKAAGSKTERYGQNKDPQK